MPRLWALKDACSDRVCPMVEPFPAPLGHRDNFLWPEARPEAWGGGECLPRPALTRQGTPPIQLQATIRRDEFLLGAPLPSPILQLRGAQPDPPLPERLGSFWA